MLEDCQLVYSFKGFVVVQPPKNSQWFNALPVPIRESLSAKANTVRYQQGDVIIWQQDDDDCALFCVLSGAIKISSCSWEGKEAVLTYLAPGSWFGEIAMFDGRHRTHTAQAHEDAELLKVSKADIMSMLANYPEFYAHIIQLLCEKVRLLMDVVEEASLQPLPTRLARRLMMLAGTFGVHTPLGIEIQLRLPQEELGQMLGTSRQSTNKLLKKFEQDGLISVAYRNIVVKQPKALKAML